MGAYELYEELSSNANWIAEGGPSEPYGESGRRGDAGADENGGYPAEAAQSTSRSDAAERAETLGREMVALTAHLSAAEARFLELLAEFDREKLWERFGCRAPRSG